MSPPLDNPSLFHNDDIVSIHSRLQTMGDDDYRTSLKQIVHRNRHRFFRKTIQRGGRFVKKNNGRVLEENLCNSESLTLSSGKSYATFSDLGIQTVRKIKNKTTLCHLDGSFYAFLCDISINRVEKVLSDTSIKNTWLLGQVTDMFIVRAEGYSRASIFFVIGRQYLSVNSDITTLWSQISCDQFDEC